MGCEPSGKGYADFELLKDKIPHNPFVNCGHLMAAASIFKGCR